MVKREGVRRLSIVLGILTAIVVFFAIVTSANLSAEYVPRIALVSLVCGAAAWGLVHLIAWVFAWVFDGFKRDRSTQP